MMEIQRQMINIILMDCTLAEPIIGSVEGIMPLCLWEQQNNSSQQ